MPRNFFPVSISVKIPGGAASASWAAPSTTVKSFTCWCYIRWRTETVPCSVPLNIAVQNLFHSSCSSPLWSRTYAAVCWSGAVIFPIWSFLDSKLSLGTFWVQTECRFLVTAHILMVWMDIFLTFVCVLQRCECERGNGLHRAFGSEHSRRWRVLERRVRCVWSRQKIQFPFSASSSET